MSKVRYLSKGGESGLLGSIGIDIIGQRFGKLVVIRDDGTKYKSGNKKWVCQCDCGTEKSVESYKLRNGMTKSCGCLSKRKFLDQAFGLLLSRYRTDAKRRGYEFNIDESEFHRLTKEDCYYCGAKPTQVLWAKTASYTYNGIDRVDNGFGYTLGNVITCCGICNVSKMDTPHELYMARIYQTYNRHFK